MNKKKREEAKVAAAEAEKKKKKEKEKNIFQQAQERDKRRDRRDEFRFESLDPDPEWRNNPFTFGSPTRDRKDLNGGDRESQGRGSGHQGGVENFIWETSEKQAGGKL